MCLFLAFFKPDHGHVTYTPTGTVQTRAGRKQYMNGKQSTHMMQPWWLYGKNGLIVCSWDEYPSVRGGFFLSDALDTVMIYMWEEWPDCVRLRHISKCARWTSNVRVTAMIRVCGTWSKIVNLCIWEGAVSHWNRLGHAKLGLFSQNEGLIPQYNVKKDALSHRNRLGHACLGFLQLHIYKLTA